MSSFPLISDLPDVIDTRGWQWSHFTAPVAPSSNFWVGVDREGNRWLTKLRGDFYAYREIVFGRLAQRMKWSCQSSVFIRIDADSAKVLMTEVGEIHAAHWFMDEHVHPPCGDSCSLLPLLNQGVEFVEDLNGLSISHILDWPKSELAACLFGGNEPPGRLFTKFHEFVIIDSELMFASSPASFACTTWWGEQHAPRQSAIQLAKEVCSDFLSIGLSGLQSALLVPRCISVEENWPIAPLLHQSFTFANEFYSQMRDV
jgi:hypothetical protein